MKTIFTFLFLLPVVCFAQKTEDSKVIVTVKDTANLYSNVKVALVKNDFIVKEDGNPSVLTTYAAELKGIPGYSMVRAEIVGNTVVITGVYGLIKIDDWGYTRTPKNYKRILYFKGSKSWRKLMNVANEIQNKASITYSK